MTNPAGVASRLIAGACVLRLRHDEHRKRTSSIRAPGSIRSKARRCPSGYPRVADDPNCNAATSGFAEIGDRPNHGANVVVPLARSALCAFPLCPPIRSCNIVCNRLMGASRYHARDSSHIKNWDGAAGETRTLDLSLTKGVLYH